MSSFGGGARRAEEDFIFAFLLRVGVVDTKFHEGVFICIFLGVHPPASDFSKSMNDLINSRLNYFTLSKKYTWQKPN